MREPWRFIAFMDEGKKQLVQLLKRDKERGKMAKPMKQAKIEHLLSIPAYVVVIMPVDPRPMVFEEDFAAVSACIQNFQLAAWERGIGMLWNTDSAIYSPEFHEQLGVERGEKIVGIMQLGYPDFTPKAQERTPIEEKLTVISDASNLLPIERFSIPVSETNVFMNLPSMSRADAIQLAGEKLVELGFVTESYISSMINMEAKKDFYLGNGITASHGSKSAQDAVLNCGIVLLHFPEGIEYEKGIKVYLLMAITAIHSYHMDVLTRATTMFEQKEMVNKVMQAQTVGQFVALFKDIDEEVEEKL